MHYVREEKLPFVGSSYEFVGVSRATPARFSVPVLWQARVGTGAAPASL